MDPGLQFHITPLLVPAAHFRASQVPRHSFLPSPLLTRIHQFLQNFKSRFLLNHKASAQFQVRLETSERILFTVPPWLFPVLNLNSSLIRAQYHSIHFRRQSKLECGYAFANLWGEGARFFLEEREEGTVLYFSHRIAYLFSVKLPRNTSSNTSKLKLFTAQHLC